HRLRPGSRQVRHPSRGTCVELSRAWPRPRVGRPARTKLKPVRQHQQPTQANPQADASDPPPLYLHLFTSFFLRLVILLPKSATEGLNLALPVGSRSCCRYTSGASGAAPARKGSCEIRWVRDARYG